MKRRDRRMNRRQMATHHKPRGWTATNTDTDPGPTLLHETPPLHGANRLSPGTADATFEFGRVRVLSRQRQLLADGVPVELGTRAFELLLVLLEADGLLVPKGELLRRVWQGLVVSEENLKVQVSVLHKALGADRDVIRTEVGRGYRFTGLLRSSSAPDGYRCFTRATLRSGRVAPAVSQSQRRPVI
jgi:DNA-binding winged helix-turn-helix (wHTH) protein